MALFSISISAILIAFSAIFVLMALWAFKEDARGRLATFTVCAVLCLIGGKAIAIYASSAPSAVDLEKVYALTRGTKVAAEVDTMMRDSRDLITRTDVERWALLANQEKTQKELQEKNKKSSEWLDKKLSDQDEQFSTQ